MKHNKKVKLATIAMATVILTTGISGVAQAHMGRDNGGDNRPEMHRMNPEMRRQRIENRLNKAVEEGKINQQQKDDLLAKLKENHDQIREIRESDKTKEEKKSAITQLHDSMKQWLQDHSIDPTIVLPRLFRK